jgi:hypothetical protein
MTIPLEIWLRGENDGKTQAIPALEREPRAWTEADVTTVLVNMLRAIDRAKNPAADQGRPVALRGFSWIVNPFETGGVVIALELSLGAVIAGPFDIPERDLSALITRVMAAERAAMIGGSSTVH